ncbi:MAG: CHAP domain-containing protein [Clostridiales bacterium]|nr:CHAP domain-containing protein [Clostridiales bacterium]
MNFVKTVIAAIIAFMITLFAFASTAFAAQVEFTPRFSAPESGNEYYNSTLNVYSQCGYGMPNCTAYAYGRIYEITGEAPKISRGSAGDWWYKNIKNGYYEYGSEPKLGAIACWSNHVAIVEAIDGNTITISQSHWHGAYFDTDTLTAGTSRYGQTFYGYIYACDIETQEETESTNTKYKLEKTQYLCKAGAGEAASFSQIITNCLDSKDSGAEIVINSLALKNVFS